MPLNKLSDRTKWAIDYVIGKEHLSNIKLAGKMGFSHGTINTYRRMHTEPNIEFILKFCELFGFSLLWFIEGWGWPFKGAQQTHPESKGPNLKTSEPNYPDIFSQEIDRPVIMLCDDSLNITNVDNVLNEAISDARLELSAVQKSTLIKAVQGKIEGSGVKKSEAKQEYAPIKISEDLSLAAKVLESGSDYAIALHLNIRAFARSIQAEERIAQVERNQLDFKQEMQDRMAGMERTIKRLEVENQALKGCAGDSPPFSLSQGSLDPTGTGEPEK